MKKNAVIGLAAALAVTAAAGGAFAGYTIINHKAAGVVAQAADADIVISGENNAVRTDAVSMTAAERVEAVRKAAARETAINAARTRAAADQAAGKARRAADKAAAEKAAADQAAAVKAAAEKAAADQAAADKAAAEKAAAEKAAAEEAAKKTGFDAIISNLKSGQAYAYVDLGAHHKALLVCENGCMDDGLGNKVASYAKLYGYDANGNVKEYTELTCDASEGNTIKMTSDGRIWTANNDEIAALSLDEQNGIVRAEEQADRILNDDGTYTYYYMNYAEGHQGEVDNSSLWESMANQYNNNAVSVVCTVVQ